MKKPFFICSCLLICFRLSAQSVSDILETGIVVKQKEKIFLEWKNKTIRYDVGTTPSDFLTLSDSAYFLLMKGGVNIYMKPLNPLDFSTSTAITFSKDEIDEEEAKAFSSIKDVLSKILSGIAQPPTPSPSRSTVDSCYLRIVDDITKATDLLSKDQKPELTEIFKELKNLTFLEENETITTIKSNQVRLDQIKSHFDTIQTALEKVKSDIKKYDGCSYVAPDSFIKLYVFNLMLKELKASYQAQSERLNRVQNAADMVSQAQREASRVKDGLRWIIDLGEVSLASGKISNFSLTLNADGFELSDDKEVVRSDKKVLIVRVLRMRKFQRFVPEVSAGIAYTWLSYPKYGTVTDSSGDQRVADAGKDEFKQVNFTAMINFVYYYPNSPIHPYIQLGVGANANYPTLFLGAGIRFNQGLRRIAIGGGVAGTWIQTLKTLKVGDKVSGTAEIDKDKTYQFSFPLKPYVGIQYHF